MTKDLAIKMRDALKGNKNIPLRVMAMDGPIVIVDESIAFAYTKWDDANGILYQWRLLSPNDHPQAGSNIANAVNTVAIPYEYIGVMQAVISVEDLDAQFGSIEASGCAFNNAQFKETIKNTFKEAQHPDRWRLDPKDINAIHGFDIMNTKDNYYRGEFTEPFKETRPKAARNAYIDEKIKAGEDPLEDKIPMNERVKSPTDYDGNENP